jgi:hypothetical protein
MALIRTDVSEDRIATIFRVHECEQVTEVISQKMIIIIVTAVETSNLTSQTLFSKRSLAVQAFRA